MNTKKAVKAKRSAKSASSSKPKKKRLLITDVDVPSTSYSAEALERSKVITVPCKDCGEETNPSNRSILQDGRVVHIGCPKRPKQTSPREIEKRKPALSGLPKHKGAKVPVRPEPPKSKHGDMMVMCDYQGRTCIQLKRDVNTVTYLPIDVSGFHLTYMPVQKFDERFKPIDYPLEKACSHFVKYAVDYGATQDVLDYLGRVVTITEEQATMAKAKIANKSTSGSTGAKAGRAPGERKESAASLFKELIMKGGLTDDQIFAKVKEKFGLDDKKRAYVAWYRNALKKEGKNPPEPKKPAGEKKEKAPAKGKGKEKPAKKAKKAKSKK